MGLLTGLTGAGGGSLMTPALIMLGLPPLEAVGTDLAYATLTRLVGVMVYGVRGRVRIDIVWRLAAGSVPAVLAGGVLLRVLPEGVLQSVLAVLIGLALVITSGLSLLDREIPIPVRPRKAHALLAGAMVGLLVQFTSIGAGVIVGFALLHIARLDPREVVGTTLLYGLVLGGMSLANYLLLGAVQTGTAAALATGSVPGTLLGALLSSRADPRRLKKGINVLLLLVGAALLAGAV